MPTLLGVFENPLNLAGVAEKLRNRGYDKLELYSPVPSHELDDAFDPKPSKVRLFTLIGGLLGVCTGFALTWWMSWDYPIVVGGKPYGSIPPYVIIAFELTILFGGLLTALGLFVVGGLPRGTPGKEDPAYSARFSAEDFGITIECEARDVSEIDAMLRDGQAKEVTLVEA